MRRRLVLIQAVGFVVAGAAMVAPDPSLVLRRWSSVTIYPWWAAVYVVLGVLASSVAHRAGDDSRPARMLPTASVVVGAQLAGLGLVAVKHWKPSFGMGGGYAGQPDHLVWLAWLVAAGGAAVVLAAVAQLLLSGTFPVPAFARDARYAVLGAVIVLVLPFGIAEGDPGLLDATSLGAFVLIYSGPIGVTVAGAAWLAERHRVAALGSCAAAATLSAAAPMLDLTHLHGGAALVTTAVVLAVVTAAGLRVPSTTSRRAAG